VFLVSKMISIFRPKLAMLVEIAKYAYIFLLSTSSNLGYFSFASISVVRAKLPSNEVKSFSHTLKIGLKW